MTDEFGLCDMACNIRFEHCTYQKDGICKMGYTDEELKMILARWERED